LSRPGFGRQADFQFERTGQDHSDLLGYESELYKAIFNNRQERKMSSLKNKFYTSLPKIRDQMYKEVTQRGFFSRSPEAVRITYGCWSAVLLVVMAVAAFSIFGLLLSVTNELFALFLAGSFLVFPVGMLIASRYMPRKTDLGTRTAAQVAAFRRYLENIRKYTSVENATDQFEKYLPYAIAFGLEKSWVLNFAREAMPVPGWYYPFYPTSTHSGGARGSARPAASGGGQAPSLDNAAGQMFGGLESMSTGLFTMLDQAASTFTSAPASSGSGGGGGGFSGGGGGGGGGGSSGFG
jgi:uncharacterized membrane protein